MCVHLNPNNMELEPSLFETKHQLIKEFKEKRDPIYTHIYYEIVKIRKWVAFMGILIIISLVGTILILLGGAALAL